MECCIAFRQSLNILGIEGPLKPAFYTKPLFNNSQFHSSCYGAQRLNREDLQDLKAHIFLEVFAVLVARLRTLLVGY